MKPQLPCLQPLPAPWKQEVTVKPRKRNDVKGRWAGLEMQTPVLGTRLLVCLSVYLSTFNSR